MRYFITLLVVTIPILVKSQNRDPLKTELVTTDLDNFWIAFEKARPDFDPAVFREFYLDRGSKGLKGFMNGRIKNADNLAKVIKDFSDYYASIKVSTDSISEMKNEIRISLSKLKEMYPDAVFPPVYFVIGAMNSGGTASDKALIIGAEMYGRTKDSPMEKFGNWHRAVLKPVNEIPHVVAHELVHFQQSYDAGSLLKASIKEGSADFIAELISGKHINGNVHDFANPREEVLWKEFKERMLKNDYNGWLYSSVEGRPNDLGYWMGYKITKAFYERSPDKKKAIAEILNIRDFEKFLADSGYENRFK